MRFSLFAALSGLAPLAVVSALPYYDNPLPRENYRVQCRRRRVSMNLHDGTTAD
jgi:hypothetical protein